MATSREQLLAQFEYLADELDAQVAASGLVPVALWEARPPTGEPSLIEMLSALDERTRVTDPGAFEPWLGSVQPNAGAPVEPGDPVSVLVAAADGRRNLVRSLDTLPENVWNRVVDGRDLHDVVYGCIQDDVERLRSIAVRLFEAGMR